MSSLVPAGKQPLEFHRYDYASFLAYISYAASSVVVPVVLVQLAKTLNFPLGDGGMSLGGALHMGRTTTMVLALLVSGFIVSRTGARKSLGVSILLMGFGIGLCALAPVYGILFLGLLIAGCGEGYVEAVATPFVQMLHPQDTGRYMNFTHGFWSIGVCLAVILSGLALVMGVHWRLIVASAALLTILPAILLLLPEAKGHEFPEHSKKLNVHEVWYQACRIMKIRRFWIFFAAIFLAGGGEYCLTFWLASFMQLSLKSSAFVGGLATAVFAAGMAVGRTGFGMIVPQNKLAHLLVWTSVSGIVSGFLIPLVSPEKLPAWSVLPILFLLLFIIGLATAPFWPTLQTYCVDRLPKGLDITLIYVLMSTSGCPGCGVFTLLMGIIGDHFGLTISFYLVPLCYFVMLGLILFDLAFPLHKKHR